jgi:GH24 family phage-related lysozyme (muramidase)
MNIEEFKFLYNDLTTSDNMITEGKFINSLLAGTALTAGTILGINKLSKIKPKEKEPMVLKHNYLDNKNDIDLDADVDNYNKKDEKQKPAEISNSNWLNDLALPYIVKWEGKIKDKDGNHILYDDDVSRTVKRRWNGKGGKRGIEAFIKSCVGKPTIGYGETDPAIIRKGKIDDATAKSLVQKRIIELNNYLNRKYEHFKRMNPNQKTAFISFSYNLGRNFIELSAPKMKSYLESGNLNKMCAEMADCDNVTDKNGNLVKVKGLTNRRQDEMKLFKTPW